MRYRKLAASACTTALEAIQVLAEANSGTERGPEAARLRLATKKALREMLDSLKEDQDVDAD